MQVDEHADADRREVNPPDRGGVRNLVHWRARSVRPLQPRQQLRILRANKGFVLAMATGSIIGTILGGLLLGAVPEAVLLPLLVALLLASAIKVWRHN